MTTAALDDDSKRPKSLKGESFKDSSANVNYGTIRELLQRLIGLLSKWGVETEGVAPISKDRRTDTRIYQMFWLWFSVNFNVLAFSTGSAGPAFFGLDLRNSLLILLVVDVMYIFSISSSPCVETQRSTLYLRTCMVPAYFAVLGPKLGMRGMVQSRFSWGLYGAIIPSFLNVVSTLGFLILNCIIGGQIIAAVSTKLDDTLGIVIISLISLVVTFFGYRVMHWFENFAWVPSVITFPILLGLANKHLNPSTMPSLPTPPASSVLSFASFVASSVITWHMIGAAFASAAPGIPSWNEGYDNGNDLGGLLSAVLSPSGGFSKFLLVLIALGTSCAVAPTMYTFGTSFMAITPAFSHIPRFAFAIVAEIILVPLAIIGAKKFYSTLVDILSVIGYWSTSFGAIVLIEHFVFRMSFESYDIERWDNAGLLPPGIAAVTAFLGSFGIIIPSMQQTWYTGPIAASGTGDIGVFTGAAVAVLLYTPLRAIERRLWPGR
ncbi:Purine-cytosine permease FCY21 [Psilocybe cubensis]|uniref:Purine-cytosine permease FCY21 n=1 Tax=Psilocybe cubensis TaxID=181762 RepID=A0ACB8GPZ9_PSICU|nr:Purine-cytosine permease FCY21 [Psilocybe cubensis]KAH9477487.1 Purine-cytosine permease FCY21 [Psilocybe cubensis]